MDDKINEASRETGEPIGDITKRTTKIFHDDMAALGNLPPDEEPRATDHIEGMIQLTEKLIESGHAYEAEGHVLFSVPSMPDYGKLSKLNRDELVAGARVEVAPYKKDPADFVLWKPSDETLPGWDSPWGRGRPGWHIECSAMAEAHHVQLAPHLYAGPVLGAANVQLSACIPNFLLLESIETWGGFHAELISPAMRWESGYVIPPTAPGLGVELDEDVARANPWEGDELHIMMDEEPYLP